MDNMQATTAQEPKTEQQIMQALAICSGRYKMHGICRLRCPYYTGNPGLCCMNQLQSDAYDLLAAMGCKEGDAP